MDAAAITLPGGSQLPPASLGGCSRSASGSGPGSFQITTSTLGSGACEILCAPFKTAVPNIFGTRGQFHGRQFFHGLGVGGWVGSGGNASDGERQMKLRSPAHLSPPAVWPRS